MIFHKKLLKKLLDFKNRYNRTTAKSLCGKMLDIVGIIANSFGVRTVSDCKVNLYSFLALWIMATDSLLCMSTTYYYWETNKISSFQHYAILAFVIPVSIIRQ